MHLYISKCKTQTDKNKINNSTEKVYYTHLAAIPKLTHKYFILRLYIRYFY